MSKATTTLIYTCLVGDKYTVRNPLKLRDGCDYICITDQELPKGSVWKKIAIADVLPSELSSLDPVRINRYFKWNPHLLFPQYEASVYIDVTLQIINNKAYDCIDDQFKQKNSLAIAKHIERDCVYAEAEKILQLGKDNNDSINDWLALLNKENYPKNNGLYECTIIFRRHNESRVKEFDEAVWNIIKTYSKRDQIAVPYVSHMQKTNIVPWLCPREQCPMVLRFPGFFWHLYENDKTFLNTLGDIKLSTRLWNGFKLFIFKREYFYPFMEQLYALYIRFLK